MDGIDLMATAMRAAKNRLDVAAANLANVSTPDFIRRIARVALTRSGLQTVVAVQPDQGPLQRTGRALDLAVAGPGAIWVADAKGVRVAIRSAPFVPAANGTLVDGHGRVLLGRYGPVRAGADATFDANGNVRDGDRIVDRVAVSPGTALQSGFLAVPNVNAIREMVDVMSAQRAFETAQQTLAAIDGARAKSVNEIVAVKA
jgi:flagellar basal-body rod protein FlgF